MTRVEFTQADADSVLAPHWPTAVIVAMDPTVSAVLEQVVTAQRFAARSVRGTESELAEVACTPPDLVVLFGRLSRIPNWEQVMRGSRVIVLTTELSPVGAQALGAFSVLATPFELEELEAELRRCRQQFSCGVG